MLNRKIFGPDDKITTACLQLVRLTPGTPGHDEDATWTVLNWDAAGEPHDCNIFGDGLKTETEAEAFALELYELGGGSPLHTITPLTADQLGLLT